MKRPKKKPYLGGAAYHRAKGTTPILVPLTPAEREEVKAAAALAGEPVSRFAAAAVLGAARKKNLEKTGDAR